MYDRLYHIVGFDGMVQSGDRFMYDFDNNTIIVDDMNFYTSHSKDYYDKFEYLYRDYVSQKLGKRINHIPFRLLLVLHEIGHAKTRHLVPKKTIKQSQEDFKSWRMFGSFHPDKWYYYRQMPHEKLADEWVVEFLRRNI